MRFIYGDIIQIRGLSHPKLLSHTLLLEHSVSYLEVTYRRISIPKTQLFSGHRNETTEQATVEK